MSEPRRGERGLEALAPAPSATRRAPWVPPLVAFAAALLLTLVAAASLHPFQAAPTDVVSYDAGFAAGLADGAAEARATTAEAEALAYRRGRESPLPSVDAGTPSLVDLLRRVGSGEVLITSDIGDASATYQRGYRAGYADARLEAGQ